MGKTFVWLSVLIFSFASNGDALAEEPSDVSPKWKRDKILYTYGQCLTAENDIDICCQLIKDLSKLEDTYTLGLSKIIKEVNINLGQVNKQSEACHRHSDYKAFVDCHIALLGRIEDEIKGQTLLVD